MTLRDRLSQACAAYIALPGKSANRLSREAGVGPSRVSVFLAGGGLTVDTADALCAAIRAGAPGSHAAALASFPIAGASHDHTEDRNGPGT